jgi:Cu+-exporting ATPase
MTHHESKTPGGGAPGKGKDPVCGMTVSVDTPRRMEHDGKTYAFCSASCMEKFRKEPARYAA